MIFFFNMFSGGKISTVSIYSLILGVVHLVLVSIFH